jgi:hypothetical protein
MVRKHVDQTRRVQRGKRTSRLAEDSEASVGQLIALVATAFSSSSTEVVDEIARMASTLRGEDSDLTRETILSYIKEPKSAAVAGKPTWRRNRLTPIHHRFAHLVINYLDGRRPQERRFAQREEIAKISAWREARALCKDVLLSERNRRFERALGSDPGTQATIGRIEGVYAVCRQESRDRRYHQELLILRNVGTRKVPRCYCTYVSENVVTRGEWMLVGNIIHCDMSGFREDNTHEIRGLYLSHLSDQDLLSGFLAGTGTDVKIPVATPIVAVKVSKASSSILELGDLGDECILNAFRQVKADLEGVSGRLHEILRQQMAPVIFHASVCNPELRMAFDGGRLLIHERLEEFAKSTIS